MLKTRTTIQGGTGNAMFSDRIEGKWIASFARLFELSGVAAGDEVVIVSETQSRQLNVHLSELALVQLGARPLHVVLTTPAQSAPVPIRSTGTTAAIAHSVPALAALSFGGLVVDCTLEGMLHAPELPTILKAGSRVVMVSNEHPDILERVGHDEGLKERVKAGMKMMRGAKEMRVTSEAGTDLTIRMEGAVVGGGWGYTTTPGTITNWPGGLCLAFPARGTVNGSLVLAKGDQNLTFKRTMEDEVRLTFENDYIRAIEGDHMDGDLLREYIAVWNEEDAYAISHVGWGMNHRAQWSAMELYDKSDHNGTEQRVFAGNFLFSTGANEVAKRFTLGHFDLPMRNCSVSLDGKEVVVKGKLVEALA
ncbi:peptidase M29 [Pseudahrensia aquimaris]|uniref:Peptidase M29 n=1 Tax=Pseudahrensia aquimaris TaxID=744461 RepID=A0ABW3FI92_9HYPH